MEAGVTPPRLLEAVVTRLVPPMAREEVAGDLWERYRSPLGYVADAAQVVPFIVIRQVQRGSDGSLAALLGLVLFASFGGIWPGQGSLGAFVASGCCLGALLLRDAYRATDAWTARRALGDVTALLAGLLLSQSIVRLALGFAIGGFVFSALLMVFLRSGIELTNTGARLRMAALPDPGDELRALERNVRMRLAFETGTLALLGGAALWFGLTANRPVVAGIACGWASPTLLLVVFRLLRSRRPLPILAELERQRGERQFAWWWLTTPLFAGLAFDTLLSLQQPGTALTGIAASLMLAGLLVQLAVRRRELLGEKISQLKDLAAD